MPTLFECYKARKAWLTPAGRVRFPGRPAAAMALQGAREDFARGRLTTSHKPAPVGHGDVIRFRDASGNRRTAVIAIVPDSDMGPPWEEHDGHGPVSDWTRRDKRPGELELCRDRDSRRFYDFAEACRIARRDGWNAAPYTIEGETPRQRAARAALADFEHLRKWCADVWHWTGVCLFDLPHDGVERDARHVADAAPFGILDHAALWGIESDSSDYHAEVARELVSEL